MESFQTSLLDKLIFKLIFIYKWFSVDGRIFQYIVDESERECNRMGLKINKQTFPLDIPTSSFYTTVFWSEGIRGRVVRSKKKVGREEMV